MHIDKLPEDMDQGLRIINENSREGVSKEVINKLLQTGYIAHKHLGGWMISSKGREYLKRFKHN